MRGSRFLVQTQNNYFGQKIEPLIFYLGRYCILLKKAWK